MYADPRTPASSVTDAPVTPQAHCANQDGTGGNGPDTRRPPTPAFRLARLSVPPGRRSLAPGGGTRPRAAARDLRRPAGGPGDRPGCGLPLSPFSRCGYLSRAP
ncbi:hypothetical protein ACIBKZ_02805 [Streptomyces sp. NPDC050421]|uniref:hypothetical protein n=1 Tax=Streptomyces sp. NPDC050421 TaxID=3365613 RepID=UPI0037A0DBF6